MKFWTKPTDDLVRKALESVKTEVDRQYFFSKLKNPHWIEPLEKRGFFKHPPKVKDLPDGYVQYPFWPEFQFLKNVSHEVAEQVIDVILGIPETNNPRFYDDVIDIALKVDASLSTKLKTRILEYAQGKCHFFNPRFDEVLRYWGINGQTESAIELAKEVVAFQPNPRFRKWEYQKILEKGVRPLSEKKPYQTARILIDATATMIRLTFHQDEPEEVGSNDYSTSWCRRVNESSRSYQDSKEQLVFALTFACEKVYENAPESVSALDQALRNQRWDIFTRIRQHLYALHLTEQTKPWIRELILVHKDYAKWQHHFEFQRMIRLACEKFGADLLTRVEREDIFKAILSGPSDQFTEESFEKRKHYFHRAQLSPFGPVLFDQYADYFQELKAEEERPVTDDDYPPYRLEEARYGGERSPKPSDELAKMSDEELLSFLNEWQDVHVKYEEWWVDITFKGLAQAFELIFREVILPDESRLYFWIDNRARIERPIYVRAMVSAIHERVKSKQFDKLDQWFELCEWVLSHPDQPREKGINRTDESKDHPDWESSRRAVGDFIEMCLEEDVNVPISARSHLFSLLDKLCTQYDRRLDDAEPVLRGLDDQITEAINKTRSRALKSLVDFGYWVRRQLENDGASTPEVFSILEKRIGSECERRLTLPECALLGMHYIRIWGLNKKWAAERKNDFFPQENLRAWVEAFGNFLTYNRPYEPTFGLVRDDIEFALENIDNFKIGSLGPIDLTDALGEHLFIYYLWGVYPLSGDSSLLERFYEKTEHNRSRWSHLFDFVGRDLAENGRQLEESLIQRIIEFFDWRFKKGEPSELTGFTYWLEAKCLDAEWRLKSYSKILDISGPEHIEIYSEMNTLPGMLEDHTALVVECFAKLTDSVVKDRSNIYIQPDEAKPILRAGLNSEDESVRANAKRARENLLRCGRFDFLDEEN